MLTSIVTENNLSFPYADRSISKERQTNDKSLAVGSNYAEMLSSAESDNGSKYANFKSMCRRFPNIKFIAVNERGDVLPGYDQSGRCSSFGELGQVSVLVDEKIIENWQTDQDNIVRRLQDLEDHWDSVVEDTILSHGSRGERYDHAFVQMNYMSSGWIDFCQTSCIGAPDYYQKPDLSMSDMTDEMLQTYLLKIQNEMRDQLLELGETKEKAVSNSEGKMTGQEYLERYQKSFVYE